MSRPKAFTQTLQKRNAIKRGPTSADMINDTWDEIIKDFSSLAVEWNEKLVPFFSIVPDGTDAGVTPPDAFTNGLDGKTLYVDAAAALGLATGRYYGTVRPNTLKEQYEALYTEIETTATTLRSEFNDISTVIIGAELMKAGTTDFESVGGTIVVSPVGGTFGTGEYSISLSPNENIAVWWTDKNNENFTINAFSAFGATGQVDWQIIKK